MLFYIMLYYMKYYIILYYIILYGIILFNIILYDHMILLRMSHPHRLFVPGWILFVVESINFM